VAILKIISKKQTRVETIINMNKQRRMFFNIWCISLWLLLFRVVGLKIEDHLRGLDGQHDAGSGGGNEAEKDLSEAVLNPQVEDDAQDDGNADANGPLSSARAGIFENLDKNCQHYNVFPTCDSSQGELMFAQGTKVRGPHFHTVTHHHQAPEIYDRYQSRCADGFVRSRLLVNAVGNGDCIWNTAWTDPEHEDECRADYDIHEFPSLAWPWHWDTVCCYWTLCQKPVI
jgi:hypothetical protein